MAITNSPPAPPRPHVTPMQRGQLSATITPPWFVNGSEYVPKLSTFDTLVNGEEAFSAVYRAIESASKSVSIICWGFQPSMYFVRRGQSLMIGELLEKKAREGVVVRVLGWLWSNKPIVSVNLTGPAVGEQNAPGRRWIPGLDRPESSSDQQHRYDRWWYYNYDRNPLLIEAAGRAVLGESGLPREQLKFYSRAFSSLDSARIAGTNFYDQELSVATKTNVSAFTSHHQKTVVVDHEDTSRAVAFVMGHNMLDGYWDTSEHSFARTSERTGRNGMRPLHDYSCKGTGPIVGDVFRNFATAWTQQTGESIPIPDFASHALGSSGLRAVCQILRTQPQYGKEDIMKCYLQAANNASQYIHIENQYFRWPPLADKIKASAARQAEWGRTPEGAGSLYLFVITNSTDAGMGVGTVNTARMLESLGRADRIPEVVRTRRLAEIDALIEANESAIDDLLSQRNAIDAQARLLPLGADPGLNAKYEPINRRLVPLQARQQELLDSKQALTNGQTIGATEVPGLKMHVATLVAPDTPAGQPWQEVYIHAKLMLIDDAFMTLGSANINTRSMQADSEMNIAHHRPEITMPLKNQQWAKYTAGRVTGGMSLADSFSEWQRIMAMNTNAKSQAGRPVAQLAEFDIANAPLSATRKDPHMKHLEGIPSTIKGQLAFTCSHESDRTPPQDPEAEQLYKHARWLIKANLLKQDPTAYPPIERLLRIATAMGHEKANIELRQLIQTGKASSADRPTEVIDLAEALIARGIPSGYYSMGWYLERGYGVETDPELALKYYRKSADFGNPEGQYLVGSKLSNKAELGEEIAMIGNTMRRCAADQHHAKAAHEFAVYLGSIGQTSEAIEYLQIASAEGLGVAAYSLSGVFSVKDHADPIWGLGQAADPERQDRYRNISDFLSKYDYLNAKVPEIDGIVPLPPAKLPPWDGKFQWLEAHKANVPPPLPTDERIAEMAKSKGLDPKTGRATTAGR